MLDFIDLRKKTFGLYISDVSLKIVRLKPSNKKIPLIWQRKKGHFFDLASFGEAQIGSGIIKNGEIRDEDKFAEIIKKAIKGVGGEKLGTMNAIVSLPEEKAFLQIIQMPHLSEEDLKSAIIFEAENHIPLPIEKVYLDYQAISSFSVKNMPDEKLGKMDVLIAAFPKKIIDSYVACFKKANVNPVILEPESLSVSRALIKNESSDKPVLLIDFGTNRTIFIIFADNSVRFTFSVPISSKSFTEAISQTMKIDLFQAEKLKIKYGLEGGSEEIGINIFEALVPLLAELIEQIKKHIDYYRVYSPQESFSSSGKGIEKILICGGGAKLKGLTSFLFSQLKIPVEIGNPWVNILSPENQPKEQILIYQKEESLSYTAALGLALRGIKEE